MFGLMLCATLSLVEKLSGKIRRKHVSELHVIIVGKNFRMRVWITSAAGCRGRSENSTLLSSPS